LKTPSLNITGSGLPFIWMHGMLNSVESDSLYSLIDFDQLSKSVSLVRYDTCNKSVLGDYSWDATTEELLQIVKMQNYQSMILGGCSMGSGAAIHAAIKEPLKVKALVLVTPPPAWEARIEVKAIYRKIISRLHQNSIPEFLKRLIAQNQDPPNFYEHVHPGTRKRLLDCRLSFAPEYYPKIYLGGAESDLPEREQIGQINVPTLIVAYINDPNHPLEIAQEINSLIKGSELITVSSYQEYLNLQHKMNNFIGSVVFANKS